jgi:hypothetical protein
MILARPPTDLRAQLAAVISPVHSTPHGYNDVPNSSSASPHDHNIDPAIGGPGGMMSAGGDSGGDDSLGDGRKGGKRELSQSKRAAQNRAAQVCCRDFIFGNDNGKLNTGSLKVRDGLVALSILMSSSQRSKLT